MVLCGVCRHCNKEVGVMQHLNRAFQENIAVYRTKISEVVGKLSQEELLHRYRVGMLVYVLGM